MLPIGHATRAAIPADLEAVAEVMAADDLDDVGEIVFDDRFLRRQWDLAELVLASDTLVVTAPDRAIVAYAQASKGRPDRVFAFAVVHPEHRGRGLGSHLLAWTEHRASALLGEHGGVLKHGVNAGDAAALSLLAAEGFRVEAHRAILRIDLPSEVDPGPPPPEILIAGIDPMNDAEVAHTVLSDAFADDPDPPTDVEPWIEEELSDPGFSADLWFVALEGSEPVGAVIGQVWDDRGWIQYVGVRERWRRRGVAIALLRHSFATFASRGLFDVTLSTDTEGPYDTLALYQRTGMRIAKRWTRLDKDIPEAQGSGSGSL